MDRFDGTNPDVDLHGAGKDGYKEGDTKAAVSYPNAQTFNSFQEELLALIEANGLTPAILDLGQLSEVLGDGEHGIYGDGSDGARITAGDFTMVRDLFQTDMTVSAGDTFFTDGFILHVKGTLTLTATGIVSNDGLVGVSGGVGGAGGDSRGPNTVQDGTTGGAGGGGGGNGVAGGISANSIAGPGGAGGDSGGNTGGAGGAVTPPDVDGGQGVRALPDAASGRTTGYLTGAGMLWMKGGAGGGGGADGGGGGGGAGGVMIIKARRIVLDSGAIIRNNGGGGGLGDGGANSAGGGGGGGGMIIIIRRTIDDQGATIEAAGGPGGGSSGTGDIGTVGSAGTIIQLRK